VRRCSAAFHTRVQGTSRDEITGLTNEIFGRSSQLFDVFEDLSFGSNRSASNLSQQQRVAPVTRFV
jgi:hypothetical protein